MGLGRRLGVLLVACGCSPPSSPAWRPPHHNGLIPVAQIVQPTEGAHLAQLAALDERWVYVANSNDVLAVYELTPASFDDGDADPLEHWEFAGEVTGQPGLELRLARAQTSGPVRCTTLAIDEATASLYCASDDGTPIHRFDLEDPADPRLDQTWSPEPLYVRDLAVVDGALWLARWDQGLARASIASDGRLGELEVLAIPGNHRRLAIDDEQRVLALSSDRGLSLIDPSGPAVELAVVGLDGPALDVSVHANQAIVALGSAGARIIELSADGLELGEHIEVPGVVTAVALEHEVAATVTLNGVWLWDRRTSPARRAGFRSAGAWHIGERRGSMLYARFVAGDLVVSDWNFVERFAVDPAGEAIGIDVQRAVYVAAEVDSIPLAVRNPGPIPLRVEVRAIGGDPLDEFTLAGNADEVRELPASGFEIAVATLVTVLAYDRDGLVGHGSPIVLRRAPVVGWPLETHGVPAPGQTFPAVAVGAGESLSPLWLPLAGTSQRVVFWGSDCVAMWPEIEDLAWRLASGESVTPILVAHQDVFADGLIERWGLGAVVVGVSGEPYLPAELLELNPWPQLYEQGFGLHELPSAAYHPTDYEIGAEGDVTAVEREYRGRFPLGY